MLPRVRPLAVPRTPPQGFMQTGAQAASPGCVPCAPPRDAGSASPWGLSGLSLLCPAPAHSPEEAQAGGPRALPLLRMELALGARTLRPPRAGGAIPGRGLGPPQSAGGRDQLRLTGDRWLTLGKSLYALVETLIIPSVPPGTSSSEMAQRATRSHRHSCFAPQGAPVPRHRDLPQPRPGCLHAAPLAVAGPFGLPGAPLTALSSCCLST